MKPAKMAMPAFAAMASVCRLIQRHLRHQPPDAPASGRLGTTMSDTVRGAERPTDKWRAFLDLDVVRRLVRQGLGC